MTYRLRFHELALKEWKKLSEALREQFKKKLAERLQNPRVPSAALSGMPDCFYPEQKIYNTFVLRVISTARQRRA